MEEETQQTYSSEDLSPGKLKGRRKTKDLPPNQTCNSRDPSPRNNNYEKNTIDPLPSRDECPKIGNNRGPLEVFQKYLRMIKPLYGKLSNKKDKGSSLGHLRMVEYINASAVEKRNSKSRRHSCFRDNSKIHDKKSFGFTSCTKSSRGRSSSHGGIFSRRSHPSPMQTGSFSGRSCPASTRSSPDHSGVLTGLNSSRSSTLEELQSAVQDAITHCKNSNSITNEAQVSER